jgi:hypothetical protein
VLTELVEPLQRTLFARKLSAFRFKELRLSHQKARLDAFFRRQVSESGSLSKVYGRPCKHLYYLVVVGTYTNYTSGLYRLLLITALNA